MTSVAFDLPEFVHLSLPRDCAKNFPDRGITILEEATTKALVVSWDNEIIQFSAQDGTVKYPLSIIRSFYVNRGPKSRLMDVCSIDVELREVSLTLVYAHRKYEANFDKLLSEMLVIDLPIKIQTQVPSHIRFI